MPATTSISPTHKTIRAYYETRRQYEQQGVAHETAVRSAFQNLLAETGRPRGWTLIPELSMKVGSRTIRPDGTLRDEYYLPRGYWEAKDEADDLDTEIQRKRAKGYPLINTIFEDTRQAALYQDGQEQFRADLTNPQQLADLLTQFYAYAAPDIESFEQAVTEFKERVPELARGLAEKITAAHKDNKKFQAAYETFFEVCRTALNPNLSQAAVDEMLVQHLLTERLIRKIFDNPEFTRRNVIAAEVEKVIDALVSHSFDRDEFMRSLDRFYLAIENAAHGLTDFAEKQHFLNSVYERFFQGYSVKLADTHGIVYTPQPIVDFMCASVVEVLQTEFGKSLGDPDVLILDPCTGTGNFIVNLLRRIPRRDLPQVYRAQLFANEVMLLPYYIAALNIEHAYYELTGQYEPFEGLCFVDTLDMAEGAQMRFAFMTEANTSRVERQKQAPITVIIANPPYNMHQQNENDNNRNRRYEIVDKRVSETYAKDSRASNVNKLVDPHIKFFRWATDRLGSRDGIVCLVTNNSFIDQTAFDGMRKHLLHDFTRIYHVDLHGNVRHNPKISGTSHNVFGIQVGVGITVAIRSTQHQESKLFYHRVPEEWRKEDKNNWLTQAGKVSGVGWEYLTPDSRHSWLKTENAGEYDSFMPVGSKETKTGSSVNATAIFKTYTLGLNTNRDAWVYDFHQTVLRERIERCIETYNSEIDRWKRAKRPKDVDNFVTNDETRIKWSSRLKEIFQREIYAEYDEKKFRSALYRPFSKQAVFFDFVLNHRQGVLPKIFPDPATENENLAICATGVGAERPFASLTANIIPDLNFFGPGTVPQWYPFYTYDEDGSNRRENITDWALQQFRAHYRDESISKWDIFYYVYGLLHHPGYRARFADNLKRDLPRIPFAPDFRAFADAGQRLADLHLNYETAAPYPLRWIESADKPLSYRVERMRLDKAKTALQVNDSLILPDIPPEVFKYRLGNRSALEWVIDQYQVKTDARSGITSDPNRADDERYIVNLVGRVVAVSLVTVKIVDGLPERYSEEG